jgi:flavin reductase (DIM6/NTAB) family NADH-FMN oxidoreductase RutF
MISGIVPRPIGFVSTISADGKSTNLAPFSYTQMVNHDPPVIIIGFSGGSSHPRNSFQNILETKECTVNMITEDMVEYLLSNAVFD